MTVVRITAEIEVDTEDYAIDDSPDQEEVDLNAVAQAVESTLSGGGFLVLGLVEVEES